VEASAGEHASIHVVVRGSFHLAQDGAPPHALEPGDIVLVGAASEGGLRLRCVAPLPVDRGERGAPAELMSALYAPAQDERLAAGARLLLLPAADVRRERGLSAVVGLLRGALMEPSAGHDRLARSLLDPLLAYVLHCHARGRANDTLHGHARAGVGDPEGPDLGAREPADARIARALQRLRSEPAQPWTVAALAKVAGLSRAAFARRFLAELGVPPLRYLAELRMERAAHLLAEGDASLASIAAEVGYESEFAFSRAFKRHTGEAPALYRRRRRAERSAFRASSVRVSSIRAAA
jgi:AraC-like DNA-binding protein